MSDRHTFATQAYICYSSNNFAVQLGEKETDRREKEREWSRDKQRTRDRQKQKAERKVKRHTRETTDKQPSRSWRERTGSIDRRQGHLILNCTVYPAPYLCHMLPPPPTVATWHIQPPYLCYTAHPTLLPLPHSTPHLCPIQPPPPLPQGTSSPLPLPHGTSSPLPLPHPAPHLCHIQPPTFATPSPPTFATSSPLPLPLSTSIPLPLPPPALYLCHSAHPAPYLGDEDAVGLQQLSDVLRSGQQLPHLPPQRLGDALAHQPRHLLGSHGQVAVPAGQHLRPRLQQVAVLHLLAHVPRPAQQRLVRVCRTTHTARSDPMTLSVLHVVVHGCYCTDRFLTQEFPTSWTSGISTDSKEKTPPPPPTPPNIHFFLVESQRRSM